MQPKDHDQTCILAGSTVCANCWFSTVQVSSISYYQIGNLVQDYYIASIWIKDLFPLTCTRRFKWFADSLLTAKCWQLKTQSWSWLKTKNSLSYNVPLFILRENRWFLLIWGCYHCTCHTFVLSWFGCHRCLAFYLSHTRMSRISKNTHLILSLSETTRFANFNLLNITTALCTI